MKQTWKRSKICAIFLLQKEWTFCHASSKGKKPKAVSLPYKYVMDSGGMVLNAQRWLF